MPLGGIAMLVPGIVGTLPMNDLDVWRDNFRTCPCPSSASLVKHHKWMPKGSLRREGEAGPQHEAKRRASDCMCLQKFPFLQNTRDTEVIKM